MSHAQDKAAEDLCPDCGQDWTHHSFVMIASDGEWPFKCGRDPAKDGIDPVLKFFHDDQITVIEAEKAKMAATIAEKVAEAKRERLSGLRKGIEEELRGETDAKIALLNGQHAVAIAEKDDQLKQAAEREAAFAARVAELQDELKATGEDLADAEREALEFQGQRDRAKQDYADLAEHVSALAEELKAAVKPSEAAPAAAATPKAPEAPPTAPTAPQQPTTTTPADQKPPETEAEEEQRTCAFEGCGEAVTYHCEIELADGEVIDLDSCKAGCNPRGKHMESFVRTLAGKTKKPLDARTLAGMLQPVVLVDDTDDVDDVDDVDDEDGADDDSDDEEET